MPSTCEFYSSTTSSLQFQINMAVHRIKSKQIATSNDIQMSYAVSVCFSPINIQTYFFIKPWHVWGRNDTSLIID